VTRSPDTTPDAEAMQLELYRRMSPGQRGELAFTMSMMARDVALAGIRSRHPAYSDDEAQFALFRVLVGDELFRRAWPRAPVLEP
jgi:hypothetical protein